MGSSATRKRLVPHQTFSRCESHKYTYLTYEEALDGAEAMMRRGAVEPGCHITPYPCPRCSRWHVANKRIVHV